MKVSDSKLNRLKAILTMKEDENISFHTSMKFPLAVAQIFGFFPVFGVTNHDYKALKFSWYSPKTVYSFCSLLLFTLHGILRAHWTLFFNNSLTEINQLVFTICAIISSVLFIKLARQWPEFVRLWHFIETYQGNEGVTTNLKRRIKIVTLFFLVFAAIEHLLVQMYNLLLCIQCTRTISDGFYQYFVYINWPHIFTLIDYSLWSAILFQLSNLQMTFIWTYIDIFIMDVSLAFTARIVQLRRKIENTLRYKVEILNREFRPLPIALNYTVKSLIVWRNLREEHINLERLCSKLNENISFIVLLCFWANLYFTLTQLYGSFEADNQNLLPTVNTENKNILPILLAAPSNIYNIEIERFIEQISHTNLAISGKNFFTITKGIILDIAGSIVTYELVLIQFHINWGDSTISTMESPLTNNSLWLC